MGTNNNVIGKIIFRFFTGMSAGEGGERQLGLKVWVVIPKLAELKDMTNPETGDVRWVEMTLGKSYFLDATARCRFKAPFYKKGENERGIVIGWRDEFSMKGKNALCTEVARLIRTVVTEDDFNHGARDFRKSYDIVKPTAKTGKNSKNRLEEVENDFVRKGRKTEGDSVAFKMDDSNFGL